MRPLASRILDVAMIAVAVTLLVDALPRVAEYGREWWGRLQRRHGMDGEWTELAATGHAWGNAGGVEVVVFLGDYECSFCRAEYRELKQLISERPSLRVAFVHFPLPTHRNARLAAQLAWCAAQLGFFETVHSFLFEDESWVADPAWGRIARKLTEEPEALVACAFSNSAVAAVKEHEQLATRTGSRGTPTLLIGGQLYFGFLRADQIIQALGGSK